MRSRSEWQNDADHACAESAEAGTLYTASKRELLDAQSDVERATAAVASAEMAVVSAEAAVESARAAVSSAREELSAARDADERAAARAALSAAEADLSDARSQLMEARGALSAAQRELSNAERRLSDAERAVLDAQSKVDRAKGRIEELIDSARCARSSSEGADVPDGPARFADHFSAAREAWTSEREFFGTLIEQLQSSLTTLESAVEEANQA